MMKRLLVLGACDSTNLGDPVICDCVAAALRERYPDARVEIRDLVVRDSRAGRTEPDLRKQEEYRIKTEIRRRVSRLTPVDLVLPQQQRRVDAQRAYLDRLCETQCDAVIFAGGQMFMDLYALFLEYCLLRFARRGIPVFFNACGTGPDYSRTVAARLKRATEADCVKYVSCRDDVAKAQRLYVADKVPVRETADPALRTARVYGVEKDPGADTVGLGVIYPKNAGYRKNLRFWQNVIRELERRGLKWKIFTNGDPVDLAFGRAVLAQMPELQGREAQYLCPRDSEPEELVRHIAGFSGLIASRLHSHIIAASLDIPSVAVVWDDKLPKFFGKLGHPERCVRIGTAPEQVVDALLLAQRQGYDRELLRRQADESEQQLLDAIGKEFPQWGTP